MNIASIVSIDLRHIQAVASVVRWTTAPVDLKDSNGDLFLSFGAYLAIDKVTVDNSIKGKPLTLTLSGLDTSVLSLMQSISINRVRVTIQRVFFDDSSNNIISKEVYFKGWGTAPEQQVNYSNKTPYVSLQMECYSIFDLDKKPSLMRANQQTHQFNGNPSDEFFKYANVDMKDDAMWKKQ